MTPAVLSPVASGHPGAPAATGPAGSTAEAGGDDTTGGFARALGVAEAGQSKRAGHTSDDPEDTEAAERPPRNDEEPVQKTTGGCESTPLACATATLLAELRALRDVASTARADDDLRPRTMRGGPALAAAGTAADARALLQPLADAQVAPVGLAQAAGADAPAPPFSPALAGPFPATATATATVTAAGSAGPVAEARLTAAPGSGEFSSQLGAQLSTFVRDGVQHARLHLHPAELGPVTVRIQIDGQAAQVHMAAEHALTRQALEQSMPLLAGSLREAGLTLSGGGVFEQPRQREGGDAPGQPGTGPALGHEPGSEQPLRGPAAAVACRGVVDLVA